MSDKKELSKEDQEALERYNNYVLRMRKGSSIEISKEDNDKKNKQKETKKKETKIKVPEGTSDEDREALERYNNYVQGMNTKNNNKDFLGEKNSQGNSGKDFEVKITKKEQEKKERTKIKAPKDAKDEDKIALERYNKFVSNQITNISKRKHSENNIFKKDISSIAWKIRLIFLILAVVFFLWALKDQMFSFI